MKIRTRMILGFAFAVLLPALLVLEIFFHQIGRHIVKTSQDQLGISATIQKSRVEELLHSGYDKLTGIASSTRLRRVLFNYIAYASDADYDEIKPLLRDAMENIPDILTVAIYDLHGNLIIAEDEQKTAASIRQEDWFERSKKRAIADIDQPSRGDAEMVWAAPVTYENEVLGVMVIRTAATAMRAVIEDYAGLGKTGETMIARFSDHGQVKYLMRNRLYQQFPKNFSVASDDLRYPIIQALQRYEGLLTRITDYRGKNVFAATRFIREEGWGLVVKIDRDEVMGPVLRLRRVGYLILVAVSVLSWFITALWSAPILSALQSLKHAVEKIQSGERSVRIDVRGAHEIAELAQSFDKMALSLADQEKLNKKLMRELDRQNHELQTLLHILSHDLKEPLRAVHFFSSSVYEQQGAKLDEKSRDFLKRSQKAAKDMEGLLDDILRLSKASRIELPTRAVAGEKLVDRALDRLGSKIQSTKTEVLVSSPLPAVWVDETWGVQALYNLISNAIKFTREGTAPQIEISGYESNRSGVKESGFVVADRGLGVPDNQRERIFELFQRAVSRDVEGSGAGLAIVREIAKRHGGNAWVEPREGGGSRFFITFSDMKGGGL